MGWQGVVRGGLFVREADVGLKGEGEAVLHTRAHDEFVVALQDLQVVHIAVVGAVFWIVGDGLQWFPLRLKVVFQNIGALPLGAQRKGSSDAVAAVGGADCEDIAHAVKGDLLL